MSNQQYFVPAIEDLFVSYECEERNRMNGSWYPWIVTAETINEYGFTVIEARGLSLRTPYLTREQIEAEGWTFEGESPVGYEAFSVQSGGHEFWIHFHLQGRSSCINRVDFFIKDKDFEPIFIGAVKSINEFKKVSKMVGVNARWKACYAIPKGKGSADDIPPVNFFAGLAIVSAEVKHPTTIEVEYNEGVTNRMLEAVTFKKNGMPLVIIESDFKKPEIGAGVFITDYPILSSDIITLSSTNPQIRDMPVVNNVAPN